MAQKKTSKNVKQAGADVLAAMHEADTRQAEGVLSDPVPPAEDGGHAHSAAAHLGGKGEPHTKPAGNLRHGSHPGALREPPMVVQRVGKQHR